MPEWEVGYLKSGKLLFCTLLIVFLLCGCGGYRVKTIVLTNKAGEEESGRGDLAGREESGRGDLAGREESGQGDLAGREESTQPDSSGTDGDFHSHHPIEGNNIVDHENVGYCGNTVTTISNYSPESEDAWEKSFWGSDSVALTDLLLYLDYREDICRCMPEYRVDTEFGEDYGINLTEGYVRHGDKQVDLTPRQAETVREIIERICSEP